MGELLGATAEKAREVAESVMSLPILPCCAQVGELLGATAEKAREVAESVMSLERQIANFTEPPEQRRDVKKLYHNMTLEQLTNLAPFVSGSV